MALGKKVTMVTRSAPTKYPTEFKFNKTLFCHSNVLQEPTEHTLQGAACRSLGTPRPVSHNQDQEVVSKRGPPLCKPAGPSAAPSGHGMGRIWDMGRLGVGFLGGLIGGPQEQVTGLSEAETKDKPV